MMDKDVKKRWLKALTSGDYKQGQNSLCFNEQFCCLGVLGDIEDLLHYVSGSGRRIAISNSGAELYGSLPQTYIDSVGLSYQTCSDLMDANDRSNDFEEAIEMIKAL